jgi:hypothetical protein
MRSIPLLMACALFAMAAGGTVFAADESKAPGEPDKKLKRVVHSIELAVNSKEPFSGAVTLKLVGGKESSMLTYYWGGKCKKTSMPPSRIELLQEAMKQGYAVEIPSSPLAYGDRIYMCIRSLRIIKD